uniref:ARAD1D26136p n=1 Tax=Blastobotrys adeninivorans TaxID=409370 RepID=A0A060TAD4_BLAAD
MDKKRSIALVTTLALGRANASGYESCISSAAGQIAKCPDQSMDCLCHASGFVQELITCVREQPQSSPVPGSAIVAEVCGEHRRSIEKRKLDPRGLFRKRDWGEETDPEIEALNHQVKMNGRQNGMMSRNYASGMLIFLALVIVLRTISNIAYKASRKMLQAFDTPLSRKIRKHLLLPATAGTKHSHPHYAGPYSFNIPTRAQTLILVAYYIINFVIYFPNYTIVKYPYDQSLYHSTQLSSMIADRAGIIAISQFPFLLLFGGRNNFLIWVTGWPLDYFNVLHKWIGRNMVINLIIHAICYTVYCALYGSYSSEWTWPIWYWGFIGLLAGGIIVGQSVHYLRALKYELFLIVHILLAVLFTIAAWKHLEELVMMEYVYAAVACWCFDRLLRLVRIVWSGVRSKAIVTLKDDNIIEIDMEYSRRWKPFAGAYVFVHFLRWNRFWQNHPFTVIESPKETNGRIKILARTKAGITNHTKTFLEQQPGKSTEIGVLIEGPYGTKHHLQRYERIVLVAGGIGVTGVYCYAHDLRRKEQSKQRISFVWVVPDERPLKWFAEELSYLAEDPRFDVEVYINHQQGMISGPDSSEGDSSSIDEVVETTDGAKEKNENDVSPVESSAELHHRVQKLYQTPDLYNRVKNVIREEDSMTAFMVCGPGTMNDCVRKSVRDNLVDAKSRVDYFEEAFSW